MGHGGASEPRGGEFALDAVAGGFRDDSQAMPPLFRPEALAAAVDRGFGKPVALLPITWSLLTLLLAIMAVVSVAFLFSGRYARKESAIGIVRAVGGDVRVAPNAPGTVERVLVSEGQRVRAGQTLLTVLTSRNSTDGRPMDQNLINSLDREAENLRQRLAALDDAAGIDRVAAPQRLSALQSELAAVVAQEGAASERLDLARSARDKALPVAERGFISAEAMRRRQDEIMALQQTAAEARAAQARLRGQISEARSAIAQRPMTLTQERGQVMDLLSRVQRDRAEYAGRQGFAVVAPTAGRVTAVQIVRGQPVDPQSTLMTVSSAGSGVSAEIFVPSRAIGFLEPGQKVRVRYDAFPYQRFGTASGTVKAISATVLRPQEVDAAIRVEEPVYRVLVSLDRDSVTAYGRRHRIRPGFALTADVVLDERTFAQWLLDPIMSLRGDL